jgi:hypothetical protein
MDALGSTLDDDFVVFHSVAWHAQSRKPDGEADFLIAHPELGFIVVEVKGGAIDFEASRARWSSRDRLGETHAIKDPFTQALNAKHEIVRELLDDPRWPRGRRVQMGYVVIFPDMVVTASGFTSRGKRDVLLGKNDLATLGHQIQTRLRYWQQTDPAEPPGPGGVEAAVERFGRSWSYRIPLREAIEGDEQRIIELTGQQMEILTALGRHRRVAIGGCAGSGKSLLAIAKAEELARSGKRVLLTCFNRALAQHWNSMLDLADGVEVRHFHGFCRDRVMAAHIKVPSKLTGDAYASWLPTGLLDAIATDPKLYDVIIVDEGQDFATDWLEALELLLDDQTGIFYVFFDDNQRLHQSDKLPGWLGEPYELTRNVRNSDSIGELVREFYSGPMRLSGVNGQPVKVAVELPDADGVPGTIAGLRAVLRQLRDEGADPADIAILTGHKFDRLLTHRRMGPWTLHSRDEAAGNVLVETIHSFKGQDSAIVILADLGDLAIRADGGDRTAEATLYVGMSRARSLLILLVAPEEIPPLQRRLTEARSRDVRQGAELSA